MLRTALLQSSFWASCTLLIFCELSHARLLSISIARFLFLHLRRNFTLGLYLTMAAPGRSLDPAWDYFTRDSTNTKYVKAMCKGCGQSIAGLVERMRKHINGCEQAQSLFKHSILPFPTSEDASKKRAVVMYNALWTQHVYGLI